MKLDRLKELAALEWAASPRFDSDASGWIVHGVNRNRQPKIAMGHRGNMELIAEALNALPGLLRVCDAYVADAREPDCMGREEIQCPPSRDCRDCAKIQAEKKLWELLG